MILMVLQFRLVKTTQACCFRFCSVNAMGILKLMLNHRKQCVLSLAIASAGAAIPKHFRNYHVEEKGGSLRETRKESIFEIPNLRNLVLSCYSVVVFFCVPNLGVPGNFRSEVVKACVGVRSPFGSWKLRATRGKQCILASCVQRQY